jgi:hypothetical protein
MNVAATLLSRLSKRMLSTTVATIFPSDLDAVVCEESGNAVTDGFGEPGGIEADLVRGFRPDLETVAGVAGGGMPLASALLPAL